VKHMQKNQRIHCIGAGSNYKTLLTAAVPRAAGSHGGDNLITPGNVLHDETTTCSDSRCSMEEFPGAWGEQRTCHGMNLLNYSAQRLGKREPGN
jgi:hypothetical protein